MLIKRKLLEIVNALSPLEGRQVTGVIKIENHTSAMVTDGHTATIIKDKTPYPQDLNSYPENYPYKEYTSGENEIVGIKEIKEVLKKKVKSNLPILKDTVFIGIKTEKKYEKENEEIKEVSIKKVEVVTNDLANINKICLDTSYNCGYPDISRVYKKGEGGGVKVDLDIHLLKKIVDNIYNIHGDKKVTGRVTLTVLSKHETVTLEYENDEVDLASVIMPLRPNK